MISHFNYTTMHPWRDSHYISKTACEVWRGKGLGSNLQQKDSYTYTLRLCQNRILSCIKKKKL